MFVEVHITGTKSSMLRLFGKYIGDMWQKPYTSYNVAFTSGKAMSNCSQCGNLDMLGFLCFFVSDISMASQIFLYFCQE